MATSRLIATQDMFPLHPGYTTSGRTYSTWDSQTSSGAGVIDTIYFHPFRILTSFAFTAGQLRMVTGGAASSAKVGIWANSAVSNRPLGAPLFVDNTGVATTSSNANAVPALAGTLSPGFYWAGTKVTGTPPSFVTTSVGSMWFVYYFGWTGGALVTGGVSFADTYSNNMPTLTEGASFSQVTSTIIPVLGLTV